MGGFRERVILSAYQTKHGWSRMSQRKNGVGQNFLPSYAYIKFDHGVSITLAFLDNRWRELKTISDEPISSRRRKTELSHKRVKRIQQPALTELFLLLL